MYDVCACLGWCLWMQTCCSLSWKSEGNIRYQSLPSTFFGNRISCFHLLTSGQLSWEHLGIPLPASILNVTDGWWDCKIEAPCPPLCGFWGSELKPSQLHGKSFTHWAVLQLYFTLLSHMVEGGNRNRFKPRPDLNPAHFFNPSSLSLGCSGPEQGCSSVSECLPSMHKTWTW